MFATLQIYLGAISVLLIGIAVGGAWICAILGPNVFYDKLDAGRANTQVKALLRAGSTPVAGLLLAASCCAFLAGALATGILSLVSAIGFFLNRWTLSGFKRGETPPGARRRRKSQQIVAVSLSLLFLLVAIIAGVLAIIGI
jgi:hypothetical protein